MTPAQLVGLKECLPYMKSTSIVVMEGNNIQGHSTKARRRKAPPKPAPGTWAARYSEV